jgi:hypothetical protein
LRDARIRQISSATLGDTGWGRNLRKTVFAKLPFKTFMRERVLLMII